MSSLSRELIVKLAKESDAELLREVLHYYVFLKQKKEDEIKRQWDNLEEVKPDEWELKIINDYKKNSDNYEFVCLEEVLKELSLNESEL